MKDDDTALNRLVVTSGDFGLNHLARTWNAFVSELFRNYVVCFVGYSISDPVLRYMMDALAVTACWAKSRLRHGHWKSCDGGWKASRRVGDVGIIANLVVIPRACMTIRRC